MLSFLQHHDLRCLVIPIVFFITAPGIVGRTLWDGRPTRYGRSARTVILELQVLIAIFIWNPGDAALELAQERGCVLAVCQPGGELVFCWFFRSHRRG
jgi:hypothetical protein